MKTFENQAAQGDLLITRIDQIPADAKERASEKGQHVVAHSETGHHHWISSAEARFYGTEDPLVCYLHVDDGANLVHERSFDTHETIRIPPGDFELRRQREYTPEGWRRVED